MKWFQNVDATFTGLGLVVAGSALAYAAAEIANIDLSGWLTWLMG